MMMMIVVLFVLLLLLLFLKWNFNFFVVGKGGCVCGGSVGVVV